MHVFLDFVWVIVFLRLAISLATIRHALKRFANLFPDILVRADFDDRSPIGIQNRDSDSDFSVKIGVTGIRNSDQIKRYVLDRGARVDAKNKVCPFPSVPALMCSHCLAKYIISIGFNLIFVVTIKTNIGCSKFT